MRLSKLDPFEKTPNRIGELINSSDKSLKQIGQEININYETLSAYKRQLRRPKKENAKILAEYFGVTLPYLLGLDDDSCIDGSKNMTPFQTLVKNSKLSLKEISEATGIGYSTVGNYNQGSRIPNARNAQLLSEYFGVSISYLLGHEENYTPNKTNARISIELVKELSSISEKRTKLHQEYIELDKKERDILKKIKEIVR
ncbi:helix-turn-helix domain-containing protein [Streptococcus mitis]|uniref:helix-turn-helix domain-containing protein n=1 Tax=Streptococcus mitis TaxID=28037 RepID=UPI0027D24E75|nr:helix-turn-helix transcriptional regulator [Streptococcus mitis]